MFAIQVFLIQRGAAFIELAGLVNLHRKNDFAFYQHPVGERCVSQRLWAVLVDMSPVDATGSLRQCDPVA